MTREDGRKTVKMRRRRSMVVSDGEVGMRDGMLCWWRSGVGGEWVR